MLSSWILGEEGLELGGELPDVAGVEGDKPAGLDEQVDLVFDRETDGEIDPDEVDREIAPGVAALEEKGQRGLAVAGEARFAEADCEGAGGVVRGADGWRERAARWSCSASRTRPRK